MNVIIFVIFGFAMVCATVATEIEPPKLLIKGNAWLMNEDGAGHLALRQVDLASIRRSDPAWTEAKLKALFRSINPATIKYAEDDDARIKLEVTMIEPFKIRFTFEARHNKAAERNPVIPYTSYWLVGVQRLANEDAQQDGGGQPATRPESK